MTSLCENNVVNQFDDVTLCKHVMTVENTFIVLISFSHAKKHVILHVAITDCDYEFAVRYLVLCYKMGKILMIVIRKSITLAA